MKGHYLLESSSSKDEAKKNYIGNTLHVSGRKKKKSIIEGNLDQKSKEALQKQNEPCYGLKPILIRLSHFKRRRDRFRKPAAPPKSTKELT